MYVADEIAIKKPSRYRTATLSYHPRDQVKGEMSEWLKEHAWKACVGETLPWVRIPLSPPSTLHHIDRKNLGWLCETSAVFWRQWPLDGADTRRLISKGCQLRDVRISRAASW